MLSTFLGSAETSCAQEDVAVEIKRFLVEDTFVLAECFKAICTQSFKHCLYGGVVFCLSFVKDNDVFGDVLCIYN